MGRLAYSFCAMSLKRLILCYPINTKNYGEGSKVRICYALNKVDKIT